MVCRLFFGCVWHGHRLGGANIEGLTTASPNKHHYNALKERKANVGSLTQTSTFK
jgi:hypothetical protein